MLVDNFEIFLFVRINRAILEGQEITTGILAREFFDCSSEECKKNYNGNINRFITAKTNLIKARLKILQKEGLLEIKKDKDRTSFILNNDRVLFQRHKFPSGMKKSILILNRYNKWDAYEI